MAENGDFFRTPVVSVQRKEEGEKKKEKKLI